MTETIITAVATSIGTLIVVVGGFWIKAKIDLRKAKVETDKGVRNGVLEEWRQITIQQQLRIDALQKQLDVAEAKITQLRRDHEDEFRKLRISHDTDMEAMHAQIVVRETERIQQRVEIKDLVKVVDEKLPGPNTLADIIVTKVVGALQDKEDGKHG